MVRAPRPPRRRGCVAGGRSPQDPRPRVERAGRPGLRPAARNPSCPPSGTPLPALEIVLGAGADRRGPHPLQRRALGAAPGRLHHRDLVGLGPRARDRVRLLRRRWESTPTRPRSTRGTSPATSGCCCSPCWLVWRPRTRLALDNLIFRPLERRRPMSENKRTSTAERAAAALLPARGDRAPPAVRHGRLRGRGAGHHRRGDLVCDQPRRHHRRDGGRERHARATPTGTPSSSATRPRRRRSRSTRTRSARCASSSRARSTRT